MPWYKADLAKESVIFQLTGEIVGATAWRRWWTVDGWHPLTPKEIIDEYDWMMQPYVKAEVPLEALEPAPW